MSHPFLLPCFHSPELALFKFDVRLPWWLSGRESTCQCLEEQMAPHSSFRAWEISRTEVPGGCSPWGHKKVTYYLATKQQKLEVIAP